MGGASRIDLGEGQEAVAACTELVMCSRSLVVTEGVAAPRDQGAATSNSNAIARSRNKDMWDADAAEWQQTSATPH